MLPLLYLLQPSWLKFRRVNRHFPSYLSGTNRYLLSEGYILQKVPPGKWLGINIILWGMTVGCTAAVKNYHGLLACRILLGVFEAAMPPCLILITGEDSVSYPSLSAGLFRLLLQECGIRSRKALVDSTFGFAA
jgi:hypothetical protein